MKKYFLLATLLLCSQAYLFSGPENAPPPPPVNDDVCGALAITLEVPINADGTTATAQAGEVDPGPGTGPGGSCNSQNGWCNIAPEPIVNNSLWYTFVAPPSGFVNISIDNTDDAQLALWSVGDCSDFGTFTEIAANDDSGPGFAPLIQTAFVVPGQTYYVQIDGYDGYPYNTNITVTEIVPPPNDFCTGAMPIATGQTVTGTTVGAIPDIAPFCGTSDGSGGGVWYKWTGDGGTATITTCHPGTDYDTKIRVYTGSCEELTCVAGNDDFSCGFSGLRSTVTFASDPACNQTQYYILVHGFSSAEGNYEMSLESLPDTYTGNVVLTTQAQVDAFSQAYGIIQGQLIIQGVGITSLANLCNLQQVTGNMTIKYTSLSNLSGLDHLTSVGGVLNISYNNYGAKLTSLSGLESLANVGSHLIVFYNASLSDCCPIQGLLAGGVGGSIIISSNDSGCDSVSDINITCGGAPLITPPVNGTPAIAHNIQSPDGAVQVFPNPAEDFVTVRIGESNRSGGSVMLFDMQGRLIQKQTAAEGEADYVFDTSALASGTYVIRVVAADRVVSKKLIVE